MFPQTYNAYYNPSNNEIVLPAGIFTVVSILGTKIFLATSVSVDFVLQENKQTTTMLERRILFILKI
jgi:hypothetical protein